MPFGYASHTIAGSPPVCHRRTVAFSRDAVNDPIRGEGSFAHCTAGLRAAKRQGLPVSLIYTVGADNLHALERMPPLLGELGVDRFFIQVIGIRG